MPKNFTPEQLSAIETTDKTLLVSAAAGAGKTSTLTERIVRSLTRESNPDDISKMLIVTFTNAATDQLRNDIREAMEKRLELTPKNAKLEAQLTLLPMAKICTIDSFCNDILRKNSDKVGIPPNYRIADNAELQILSFSILSKLIGEFYENQRADVMSSEEFAYLADTLTISKSDTALEEILLKLYEKSKSEISGVGIFKELTDAYSALCPNDNNFTKHAMRILKTAALYYETILTEFGDELSLSSAEHDVLCSKDLYANAEIVHALSLHNDYLSAREALFSVKYQALSKKIKGQEKTPLLEEISDFFNKKVKADITNIRDSYFFYSGDELSELFSRFHKIFTLLSKFLKAFDEIYMQEKIRRLALEYSDIERFAFRSLYAEDNETFTDFALSLKEEYTSVYIDEYQDVNALQDKIFAAVSNEDNRFMVGDIKQSIYGFRSADPDVFASMKTSFPRLDRNINSSAYSIFMSQNFRSDKHIIDFVNEVFDKAFGLTKESIGYRSEDKLVFPEWKTSPKDKKVVICLVPERQKINGENDTRENGELAENERESTLADELQCKFVAKKISELLADKESGLKARDIAIILRKRRRMREYAKALSEFGIETKSIGDKNFFLNSEIQLALCLFNAIDNPEKDIYLAGLLASPLFNFTPDELLKMRKNKNESLYKSLIRYTKENSFEKGERFIKELEFYRTLAEGLSIDALILRLYNDTGLLELARRTGGEDNLLLLYNYARNFSASSLKGLYNFIKFINNIIDKNAEFDARHGSDDGDAVNIISIHASKGLQYKTVFYVDTNAPLKNNDSKDKIAYSAKFGISTCLRSPGGLAIVENPIHNLIKDYNNKRFLEEEFRDIYVALTRAISELYVVGKVSEDYNDYIEKTQFKARHLNEFSIYKTKTALELMLMTAKSYKTVVIKDLDEEMELDENGIQASKTQAPVGNTKNLQNEGNVTEESTANASDAFSLSKEALDARISFIYENEHLTKIPEKISVSSLNPRMLDESDSEEQKAPSYREKKTQETKKRYKSRPSFIDSEKKSKSDESAERGIATHNFMQFFDVKNFDKNGTEEELSRLFNLGFISKNTRDLVEKSEIDKFRQSTLFSEMKKAVKTYREFRFNTRLPARYFEFDSEILEKITDEELLVQGVIDCILVDSEGELHLVDYKTDRLTKKELENPRLAEQKLNESHAPQLSCYALAIEKIFGKKPKTVRVYSLPLGDTVEITLLNFNKL